VPFDEPSRAIAIRTLLRVFYRLPDHRTRDYLDAIGAATGTGLPSKEVADLARVWMSWDMIRKMRDAGMTIGGHTVRHPILSRLSREEQEVEIVGCQKRLEEELRTPMQTFAYPVGSREAFNDDSRSCLRNIGVHSAFSYYGGISNMSRWDDYDIQRVAIEQHTTFEDFRAIVSLPSRAS
jgi:hypothetical protein